MGDNICLNNGGINNEAKALRQLISKGLRNGVDPLCLICISLSGVMSDTEESLLKIVDAAASDSC